MKIRIGFNGSFGGLLYSSGYSYDPDCVYINGTGRDYYEFYIQLNRCGTLGKNSRQEDARKNPAVSRQLPPSLPVSAGNNIHFFMKQNTREPRQQYLFFHAVFVIVDDTTVNYGKPQIIDDNPSGVVCPRNSRDSQIPTESDFFFPPFLGNTISLFRRV